MLKPAVIYCNKYLLCYKQTNIVYHLFLGDTGPLVYPAGFVWIFWVFHSMTDAGTNIKLAQCLFAVIFLLNTALVFRLVPYKKLSKH